jgi:serralysin
MAGTNTAPTFTIRDGWVRTAIDNGTNDYITSVAIDKDGKILAAGGSSGWAALARYNADGSLDTTFSGDGIEALSLGASLGGGVVIPEADGTITFVHDTLPGFTVAHFLADGNLDSSVASADFPGLLAAEVLVLGNGKVVSAGYASSSPNDYSINRYNADGTFDTSFGATGRVVVDIGPYDDLAGVVAQPDGKLLVTGESSYWPTKEFSLFRLNVDGSLDTSFSGDGKLTVAAGSGYTYISEALALQADGKILVALGSTTSLNTATVTLFRYTSNGSLDTTFHGTGSVTLRPDGISGYDAAAISVQKDGKILLLGNAHDSNDTHYAFVARFLADGSLDPSFGNKGMATAAEPTSMAGGLLVQPDGKLLVYGNTNDGDLDFALMRFNADGTVDQTFAAQGNTLTGTTTFTEGSPTSPAKPVVLNSGIQVHDAELAASGYNGATLTLARHDGANAEDVFSARSGGTLSALTSGSDFSVGGVKIGHVTANGAGKLTLAFNANATETLVNTALQQIAYANTSNAPSSKVLIDWTFNDGNTGAQGTGGALAAVGSTAVTILATNDIPVAHRIADQKAVDGAAFSFVIPDSAFTDPDHDTLSYSASMTIGKLPSWLTFDAATHTLSGTPTATDVDLVPLRVTVRDGRGEAATSDFYINVVAKAAHVDGTAGADNLVGTANDDTLQGFGGNDILNGKAGADTMTGGDGNDAYYVDNAGDVVNESINGGTDTVYSSLKSYHLAPNVEYAYLANRFGGDLIGNELNNVLYADGGDNVLDGGFGNDTASYAYSGIGVSVSLATTLPQDTKSFGNDTLLNIENLAGSRYNDALTGNQLNNTLNGGAGADTLTGGDGSDIYIVDNVGDVVRETNGDPVKGGVDTINASVSFKLTGYAENLTLTGADAINATGNSLANKLVGNSGNNVLDGGAGADVMSGGLGNDTYYVDNSGDVVAEVAAGGTDTVISTVTRTLGDNQENLTLAGTAAINGAGNSLDNTVTGNSARNVLTGGAGADKMYGGLGDDFYYVDNAGDLVVESSDPTLGGTDTVNSTVTYTLGNYVENLTMSGAAAINGTGNSVANKIIGNGAANVLSGGDGADTLVGGLGNDTLVGGQGKDVLEGGSGSDVYVFNAASESGATSAAWDVVNDFVRGQDKVDLRGIDANTATVANDAFTTFIASTAAFTAAGQLKFVDGVLYGNTDGDADAEFAIQLTGITQLTTADVTL